MTREEITAKRCVNSILADLTDRSGFRQLWDELNADVRKEIIAEWRQIITVELEANYGDL